MTSSLIGFSAALVGNPQYSVLPPWPAQRPHQVVPLGPDPFGSAKDREIETGHATESESDRPSRSVCPACRAVADFASVFAHRCPACESEVNFVTDAP